MTSGRTIATNRKARHDYEVLDTVEAGLVLKGTEIKAIRGGNVNLSDSYAKPEDGELWLVTSTTEFNRPPGLSRTSRISASAPSSMALRTVSERFRAVSA